MLSSQYRKSTTTEIRKIEAKLEKLRAEIYPLEAALEPLKALIQADDNAKAEAELPLEASQE